MYKTIVVILSLLTLSACSDIDSWKIKQIIDKCEQHGGISKINNSLIHGRSSAICMDGTKVEALIKIGKRK